MSSPPTGPCTDMSTTELMQKFYEIIQIVQTFALLVQELRALCVKSFFRWLFSIIFYYMPQLNPFRLVDAYNAAAEAIRNKQKNEQNAGGGGQQTEPAKSAILATKENSEGNGTTSNPPPEPPNVCGCP
ncbi:hypothetical protein SCUCBS95973_009962 [Sporothrix curviconia]|uniref:Uncharacterized protein n=1 Tax=Sporothrix curviconia TaxID=1260050 RepID=A0ABP0CZ65_9PEZI